MGQSSMAAAVAADGTLKQSDVVTVDVHSLSDMAFLSPEDSSLIYDSRRKFNWDPFSRRDLSATATPPQVFDYYSRI